MAKRRIDPLVKGRIRLRLLEEADLAMTLAWRNQDHIRRWFFHSDVITPDQHAQWYAGYQDRDDDFVFVIEETDTFRRPVGQVALYRVDWALRTAEFGRLLIGDAEAAGMGIATLATKCLIETALGAWGLREVVLEVREENVRAIAVYVACGFKESVRRKGIVEMRLGIDPRVHGSLAC